VRPGEHLRYLVLAAQREGNRMFAAALKPLGLTPAWAEAISVLDEREPLTIRELGLLLVCEGEHPSRLVNRMVSAGLLTTEPSPADDRARWIRLTPAARVLLPGLREVEDQLHTAIETTVNSNSLETCRAVLGNFIDGLPAGEALQRRVSP
jgi:MarR family transcriptional regulator, organic hydroperoxide resistance regulator